MSFNLKVTKDSEGNLQVETYNATDQIPDVVVVGGHVEDGQTVDISVRVTGLSASASKRAYPVT